MDEDSEDLKVEPMKPLSDVLRKALDAVEVSDDIDEPCHYCFGTGTELLIENGLTYSRRCKHL